MQKILMKELIMIWKILQNIYNESQQFYKMLICMMNPQKIFLHFMISAL